jgi:hypothetical protein
MLSRLFYKIFGFGLLLVALLLSGVQRSEAQVVYAASRHMTRSQVWLSFTASGTSSMNYHHTPSRVMMRMCYPGGMYALYALLGTEEFVEYWGDKTFGSSRQKAEPMMHSAGEGVLVLTDVGGEKFVSVTGPRLPTEDVEPRAYDIANGPEANWGIETKVPARGVGPGKNTSNWWAGASAQTATLANFRPYEIHNFDFSTYPPIQNAGEEIHITQWRTRHDLIVTRRAHAWSHQDLDDLFIVELEFENTGGEQLDGTYFGVMNSFYVNNSETAYRYGHEGGLITYKRTGGLDDWYRYSEAANFAPNPFSGLSAAAFADKFINYVHDGDSASTFEEDTGGPYSPDREASGGWFPGSKDRPPGTLIAPAYQFLAPLAFHNAGTHPFNPADQGKYVDPGNAVPLSHWYQVHGRKNVDDPTRGAVSMANQYDYFLGATADNPTSEQQQWFDQIYGPYDLAPGAKAKIVLVYGFASAAEFDINSKTGYAKDITDWSHNVGELSTDARKTLLAKGEEAMLRHLEHAQFAYSNEFQIPDSPPDVDFFQTSNSSAKLVLQWPTDAEQAINPDYGTADVVGYRVYKSEWQETGPWKLVGEVAKGSDSGGTYTWTDSESLAGFGLMYNVRSVATAKTDWSQGTKTMADLPATMQAHLKNGLESGWGAPEQRMVVKAAPVLAANSEADALTQEIMVVPNPYNVDTDGQNYQRTNKIRFVGVPSKCKISIFSVAGDLIGVVDHNNPAAGEAAWLMKDRFLTGEATSGVYFYVVESLVAASQGKSASGAFVINR